MSVDVPEGHPQRMPEIHVCGPRERSQGHHMEDLGEAGPREAVSKVMGAESRAASKLEGWAQPCQPTQAFRGHWLFGISCHLLNFHSCFSLLFLFLPLFGSPDSEEGLVASQSPWSPSPGPSPANTLDTSSSGLELVSFLALIFLRQQ